MVADLKREQAEYPGQAIGRRGGAMSWYLTGTGKVIRGQVHRDPDWEDRKRADFGGLTFLGRAEYGPGGDCLPALRRLSAHHPELQPIIEQAEATKQRKAFERANKDQVRAEKKARQRAEEASVIADAMQLAQDRRELREEPTEVKRGPGRPPKSEV